MDEKRSNLYAPLRRPEDFELTWPLLPGEEPPIKWARLPACTGHCQQGKRLCVTPQACRLPDDEDAGMSEGMGAIAVPAVIAAALFVGALVALVARWM